MAAITGIAYAVTTCRVKAIRVGTARLAYAPRCTNDFTPLDVQAADKVDRYPCHKRRYPTPGGHTAVLR